MRTLLDPRLKSAIPEQWASLCTVVRIATTLDAANQPIPTTPVVVVAAIGCRIGPLILIRPSDAEIRDSKITETYGHREIVLNGHFTQILAHTMNAVVTTPFVGTETWHIVGVEDDSAKFSTRLRVEEIKP